MWASGGEAWYGVLLYGRALFTKVSVAALPPIVCAKRGCRSFLQAGYGNSATNKKLHYFVKALHFEYNAVGLIDFSLMCSTGMCSACLKGGGCHYSDGFQKCVYYLCKGQVVNHFQ